MVQTVKNLPKMQETQVWSLVWEDPLEKEMATHLSILVWRISWTEELDGLHSIRSQSIRHNWRLLSLLKLPYSYLPIYLRTCACVCVCLWGGSRYVGRMTPGDINGNSRPMYGRNPLSLSVRHSLSQERLAVLWLKCKETEVVRFSS